MKAAAEPDPARVLREWRGQVAVLRLWRPPVNALSPALAHSLGQALRELAEQPECLAIVVAAWAVVAGMSLSLAAIEQAWRASALQALAG